MIIERIQNLPDDFHLMLEDSLKEKFGALQKLQSAYIEGENTFSLPGEALFAARLDGELVGICGLNIDPYQECSEIGRVRPPQAAAGRSQARAHLCGRYTY